VSVHAASVRQAIPIGAIGGAAVIGAVIAVGMAGSVIAWQRRRARQQRRAEDARRIGHDAHRREQHVGVLFLDHQRAAAAHIERRCGRCDRGPVVVMGAGQAGRQFARSVNRGVFGGGAPGGGGAVAAFGGQNAVGALGGGAVRALGSGGIVGGGGSDRENRG